VQDRNPLARIPIARRSLKASASRPVALLFQMAQDRNPLARIPVARRSLTASASRQRAPLFTSGLP
jgi:hypothetical protein